MTLLPAATVPSHTLDVDFVRLQFPELQDGWAFLENAGGSYIPRQVMDRTLAYMQTSQVQPAWTFPSSARAQARIKDGKRAAAALVNAEADEVVIGPSTTMNIYVLAQAIRPWFKVGDEIIVTNQDHEANSGAWRRLAEFGLVIKEWQIDPVSGELDSARLKTLLTEKTRLVAFTHCSNIVGSIHDVAAIARMVHDAGALVCVDGVSVMPHQIIDVKAADLDFYAFSLYKTFGPHQGLLYGKRELFLEARNQNHDFVPEDDFARKLCPGGINHELTAALAGIGEYFEALWQHHFGQGRTAAPNNLHGKMAACYELIARHEAGLLEPLLSYLREKPGVRLIGKRSGKDNARAPLVAFAVKERAPRDIAVALEAYRIAAGHGDFYAKRCVEALGLLPQGGVVRLSIGHYNTKAELDRVLTALDAVL